MDKIRSLIIVVAVTAVITAPATLGAAPRQGRAGRNEGQHPMLKALKKLDLTEAQKTEVKAIVEASREGLKQATQARNVALKAYAAAMKTGEESGIREAGASVGTAIAEVGLIRSKTRTAIEAVLTPQQIQQLAAMKDKARDAMGPKLKEGRQGAHPLKQALARLNLTAQQKLRVAAILEGNRQSAEQAREARAAAVKAYVQAVKGGDEASIRAAGAGVGKAMADMAVIRVQVLAAVRAVLTPEQRQQLEAMKGRAQKSVARVSAGPTQGPGQDRRAGLLALLSRDRVFNRLDRNGDGAITRQEVKALRRQAGRARPAVDQMQ